MRILTRYMVGLFLGPFFFGLGAFALIVFLVDVFDKMNKIASSPASGWTIAQYMALQMPYWTIRIVPMATLLATLFCVTTFVAGGEFVASQAAGVRSRDLFRPLLWTALAVGGASFLAQETLLPACFRRSQMLWHDRIHPQWEWSRYFDAVLVAGSGRFLTVSEFNVKEERMHRPVMDSYRGGRIQRQIDAKNARWAPGRGAWVFEQGVARDFARDGAVAAERPFQTLVSDLHVPPRELVPRSNDPDEMSLAETLRYRRQQAALGFSTRPAQMAAHAKAAFPFANVVLCALGIPIALRLRRSSRSVSFGCALVLSFLYLWVAQMGQALGAAGSLPAAAAAWLPNLGFGSLAAWLYTKAEI